ncbi:hypothetical protein [Croceicoccus hydrothermalis]|uniref:hypothetical protein n=1 Tax=Croceicoccus hydrothermalis TaxID=2867964 RepID=UPI001EFA39E6|nr:hypothetical protein [Croceicoccus hydrothermalis]
MVLETVTTGAGNRHRWCWKPSPLVPESVTIAATDSLKSRIRPSFIKQGVAELFPTGPN